MKHAYHITGMTCGNCEAKVKSNLLSLPGVLSAEVSQKENSAVIEISKHISLPVLQRALGGEDGKYKISASHHNETAEQTKSWLATYKPVLLIFGYILGGTLLIEYVAGSFNWMRWMGHFMAAFFLVFSFFKLLNLKGFAENYAMYDIIAKRWSGWGYVYAFTELMLGIAFLTGFNLLVKNAATLVVMTVSIVGVLQTVLSKRKIKCACLGDVFNLPMSTITIIEDALMIGMSAAMLLTLL